MFTSKDHCQSDEPAISSGETTHSIDNPVPSMVIKRNGNNNSAAMEDEEEIRNKNSAAVLSLWHCILSWFFMNCESKHLRDKDAKEKMKEIYRNMVVLRYTIEGERHHMSVASIAGNFTLLITKIGKEQNRWNKEINSLLHELIAMHSFLKINQVHHTQIPLEKFNHITQKHRMQHFVCLITIWYWFAAWSSSDASLKDKSTKDTFLAQVEGKSHVLADILLSTSGTHKKDTVEDLHFMLTDLSKMLAEDTQHWISVLDHFITRMSHAGNLRGQVKQVLKQVGALPKNKRNRAKQLPKQDNFRDRRNKGESSEYRRIAKRPKLTPTIEETEDYDGVNNVDDDDQEGINNVDDDEQEGINNVDDDEQEGINNVDEDEQEGVNNVDDAQETEPSPTTEGESQSQPPVLIKGLGAVLKDVTQFTPLSFVADKIPDVVSHVYADLKQGDYTGIISDVAGDLAGPEAREVAQVAVKGIQYVGKHVHEGVKEITHIMGEGVHEFSKGVHKVAHSVRSFFSHLF